MSKAIFQQRGEAIDYTNSSGTDIVAMDIVAFGGHVGVAGTDIPNGKTGTLHMVGVFEMPKDSAAITAGADVYLVSGAISATQGDDGVFAGYAVAAAAADDETVVVKLMG